MNLVPACRAVKSKVGRGGRSASFSRCGKPAEHSVDGEPLCAVHYALWKAETERLERQRALEAADLLLRLVRAAILHVGEHDGSTYCTFLTVWLMSERIGSTKADAMQDALSAAWAARDWPACLDAIGWDRARKAVEEAERG